MPKMAVILVKGVHTCMVFGVCTTENTGTCFSLGVYPKALKLQQNDFLFISTHLQVAVTGFTRLDPPLSDLELVPELVH